MQENFYRDIALRTDSNIYIGVVGPVRTGKSTFIKRFMESLVLPRIDDIYLKERTKDELPQSGSGRTIMTAEPKFVPEEAISIQLEDGVSLSVRLIDCVGYMIPGASGRFENGEERLVSTPWFDHEITMTEAAEYGTHKVIADHSTIGLVITTDGSVCGIAREDYVEAEARVINELKSIGKPFVILVNSTDPYCESAMSLCDSLRETYHVNVLCVDCSRLQAEDVNNILRSVLLEFPVSHIALDIPGWVETMEYGTPLLMSLLSCIGESFGDVVQVKDLYERIQHISDCEYVEQVEVKSVNMGTGVVHISVSLPRTLYYNTISEQSGFVVDDDGQLLELLKELGSVKLEYDKIKDALQQVRRSGYGVVMPNGTDLRLEEPEIIQQGGRYTVKLKANAPAIHMIMTNVETTVSPAIGGTGASEDIVNLLLQSLHGDVSKIWDSNIFGKSLYDIAAESVCTKIDGMTNSARAKFQETLQRVVNEGAGGLICIIL